MSHQAALAFKALEIKSHCGAYAARRFAARHHISGLFRLIQQLEAVRGI